MINRSNRFKQFELNIAGSSVFGRYPKIDSEKTYNMFISDGWLVPYAGYETAIPALYLGNGTIPAKRGRAIHTSTKLNKLIVVVDNRVYLSDIFFDQNLQQTFDYTATLIGTLLTVNGVVYIAENNKPQILISDGISLYLYDQTLTPNFQAINTDFRPGYIDFHNTYFLCAASNDTNYTPPANNVWRLSDSMMVHHGHLMQHILDFYKLNLTMLKQLLDFHHAET